MSRPIKIQKDDWKGQKEKESQRKREKRFRNERKKRRDRWAGQQDAA